MCVRHVAGPLRQRQAEEGGEEILELALVEIQQRPQPKQIDVALADPVGRPDGVPAGAGDLRGEVPAQESALASASATAGARRSARLTW